MSTTYYHLYNTQNKTRCLSSPNPLRPLAVYWFLKDKYKHLADNVIVMDDHGKVISLEYPESFVGYLDAVWPKAE